MSLKKKKNLPFSFYYLTLSMLVWPWCFIHDQFIVCNFLIIFCCFTNFNRPGYIILIFLKLDIFQLFFSSSTCLFRCCLVSPWSNLVRTFPRDPSASRLFAQISMEPWVRYGLRPIELQGLPESRYLLCVFPRFLDCLKFLCTVSPAPHTALRGLAWLF